MLLTANMAGAIPARDRHAAAAADLLEYRMHGKVARVGFLRSIPFDEKGSLELGDLRRAK